MRIFNNNFYASHIPLKESVRVMSTWMYPMVVGYFLFNEHETFQNMSIIVDYILYAPCYMDVSEVVIR